MSKNVLMSHKKIIFFLIPLLILTHTEVLGQRYRKNHPFDLKRFNLGFLMGATYNRYNVKEQINVASGRVDDPRILRQIELHPQLGLNLGMITNLNLRRNLAIRFIPAISLEQRNFDYRFEGSTERLPAIEQRKIEASYLNLPILFQYKSVYSGSYRLYLLAGPQLGINLASNKKVNDDPRLLKIESQDISIVLGVGFNIYGDRIKLSPEIRYSAGIRNLYVSDPDRTSHAGAIGKLFSQVLSLNVNFE